MASGLYPSGAEDMMDGTIILSSSDITPALVNTSYTYSSAHDFWDDVTANEVQDGGATFLSGKSVTSGVFDATDYTFASVSGSDIDNINLRKYNAADASSPLLAYIECTQTTPNGNNIDIIWDAGSNKIFAFSLAS